MNLLLLMRVLRLLRSTIAYRYFLHQVGRKTWDHMHRLRFIGAVARCTFTRGPVKLDELGWGESSDQFTECNQGDAVRCQYFNGAVRWAGKVIASCFSRQRTFLDSAARCDIGRGMIGLFSERRRILAPGLPIPASARSPDLLCESAAVARGRGVDHSDGISNAHGTAGASKRRYRV